MSISGTSSRGAATGGFTPRLGTVGLLMVGRALFRGLWLAAPLLLAGTWTARELGSTIAAIGGFGWLTVLLGATEKTLLKQVPRLPRLANQTVRAAVVTVTVPLVLTLALAVALTLWRPGPALWAWGLVWAVTGGFLMTIAAVHRLDRRPWVDVLVFAGGGLWLLGVTAVTIVADLTPLAWLITCQSGVALIALVALLACRDRWRPGVRRRAATAPLRRSLLLLSLPEVLSIASVSAGYWAIALLGAPSQATAFYLAVTIAGVFGAVTVYVVRLRQPDLSLRLRGPGAVTGERRAARIASHAVFAGVGVALLALVSLAAAAPVWATLGLLTLGEILVFGQRTVAANLVENARSRWLLGNATASATGLLVAVLVLVLAVPGYGAVGAMGALLVAQICNAAYLRRLLSRPSTPPSAPPSGDPMTHELIHEPTHDLLGQPDHSDSTLTDPPPPVGRARHPVDLAFPAGIPPDGDNRPEPYRTGLSVVIPCYNEEASLDATLDEVLAELGDLDLEIICVDDGSKDGTLDVLRRRSQADPRVQFLSFTRNFGVEAAFSAGYLYARKPWLVHLDADGQFPAAEARRLVDASAGQDAVFGVRAVRQDPWLRKVGSRANQFVARRMLGIELPEGGTCFRLVRTDLARAVVNLRLGSPYFLATLPRLTDRWRTVPVAHRARGDGPARVRVLHLAGQALDLWFAFSRRPAHLAIAAACWTGLAACLLGILHLLFGLPGELVGGGAAVVVGAALIIIAVEVRCLGVITASQPRPRQFYIREATVPVALEDTLASEGPMVSGYSATTSTMGEMSV